MVKTNDNWNYKPSKSIQQPKCDFTIKEIDSHIKTLEDRVKVDDSSHNKTCLEQAQKAKEYFLQGDCKHANTYYKFSRQNEYWD